MPGRKDQQKDLDKKLNRWGTKRQQEIFKAKYSSSVIRSIQKGKLQEDPKFAAGGHFAVSFQGFTYIRFSGQASKQIMNLPTFFSLTHSFPREHVLRGILSPLWPSLTGQFSYGCSASHKETLQAGSKQLETAQHLFVV